MGLPDEYKLPANVNEVLGLMGDGVAVPAIRFLTEHLLKPLLLASDLSLAAG
jgi:DNA (cytosine-5)-methyltransferase 1